MAKRKPKHKGWKAAAHKHHERPVVKHNLTPNQIIKITVGR